MSQKLFLKFFLLLCLVGLFAACKPEQERSSTNVSFYVEKVRSFVFNNTDSLKLYNDSLKAVAQPEIRSERAFLKYADALYYLTLGIHKYALVNFNEALSLFEKEENKTFVSSCELGIANCFKLTGESDSAIYFNMKALQGFIDLNEHEKVSIAYVNLADAYQQKNDIENARKYLAMAKLNEPFASKVYTGILHLEANLYGMEAEFDSALYIDRVGIGLAVKHNYPEKLSSFYDNIARCYSEKRLYDSAAHYYRKCISADSVNGRIQLMADTYAQLVNIYGNRNDEAGMLEVAKHASALCDSTQFLRGKLTVFESLNSFYTRAQKWQRLAETKDSVLAVYKQLVNEDAENRVAEYNVAFETAQKEQTIAKQNANLQKATYVSALLTAIAVLLLFIIFGLYRNYKTRKKIAVNKAVEQQKDLNVKTVFESEQAERIRIARDLHDSLGQKLSVLKMYLSSRIEKEDKSSALLDDTIQEVRNISHDLLPEELNFGFLKAVRADIDKWKEAVSFQVNENITQSELYGRMSDLSSLNILRILRELLHNLSQYSKATIVEISLSINENFLTLQLTDNGTPFDEKVIAESKGIGWKNIFARVNMLRGRSAFNADLKPINCVKIEIPVA